MINLQPGQIIWEHYRIEDMIGMGGMARIFRVVDIHQSHVYAAKVIRHERMNNPILLPRFRHECQIHPNLNHPNIIKSERVFIDHDPPGMLLQFADGKSLRELMREHWNQNRTFSSKKIMMMIDQMVNALTYLHDRGFCHCDLKPDNILTDGSGQYYLTDFGITHRIGQRPDTQLGTPKYMSPEQYLKQEMDARTDVYAFAIIVYELLTEGSVPFRSMNEDEGENTNPGDKWEQAHMYDNPVRPSVINQHIRPEIDNLLMKALDKDPNYRHATMNEFYMELRSALEGRTQQTFRPAPEKSQVIASDMLPGARLVCTRHYPQSQKPAPIALPRQLQIGRRKTSDVRLHGGDISRSHAMVLWDTQRSNYVVYDQGSAIGTRVNGRLMMVNEPHSLKTGDLLTIGEYNFRFELI